MVDGVEIPDFMVRALLAGLGTAVIAGALGVFIVWQRMAYFGEALAHSSLLGVVLGVALGVMPWATIIVTSASVALLLFAVNRWGRTTMDSAIGVIAHGSLALGMVVLAFLDTARVDLFAYLFGDVLATTTGDLWLIATGSAVVLGTLYRLWDNLLSVVVNEEIARVEGVPVNGTKIAYLLLLSIVVAVSIKVVGVLLVIALLVIPACAARYLARSPEQMVALAIATGCLSVMLGTGFAFVKDTPAGPSIVAASVMLFMAGLLGSLLARFLARFLARLLTRRKSLRTRP